MPTRTKPDKTAEIIVVRASRANLAGMCVAHLLSLWSGSRLWNATMQMPYNPLLLWIDLSGLLLAGGMLLFSGVSFLFHLSRFVFNCPLLTLTPEGIHNGSYGCAIPFIRWQAIEEISINLAAGCLEIFVREYGTGIGRSVAAIEVRSNVLHGTEEDLFEQIKAYCADQRVGESIQFVRVGERMHLR